MEKYSFKNNYFDIGQILESGQYFLYKKQNDKYIVNINDNLLEISTINNITNITISKALFDKNIYNFFDINTDYEKIIKEINKSFPELKKYTNFGKGIRFLNQDFLLVAISFIISQNNNIGRIKKSIEYLTDMYGENNNFPTLEKLKTLTQEDFRKAGVGFRDKYLFNFVQKITKQQIDFLKNMNSKEAFEYLIQFQGIGPKVANCIILFGLHKRDVFPIDTHIKKIMQDIYFEGKETSIKKIEEFALKKFKDKASYIQQYLFYWSIKHKE